MLHPYHIRGLISQSQSDLTPGMQSSTAGLFAAERLTYAAAWIFYITFVIFMASKKRLRITSSRTRQRILDAAERTFVERGFEAAAIREIATRARVSLPVLYYHFGSKGGLIEAVLLRRLEPIRQAHETALIRIRQEMAPGRPPSLSEVLAAMVGPALEMARAEARRGSVVMRLIGRLLIDPSPRLQDVLLNHLAGVRQGFFELLARCLPEHSKTTLYWRQEFIWGALALLLCNPTRILRKTEGLCDPLDTESLLPHFLAFCAAGLQAPAPVPSHQKQRL
ncbi:MAG: TetR/AcrR family transcriptional regulator [Verrucomicrobiota bacterium]|nr:TetR family transcriptional regulator [Limisphaera sp.]MDW8380654.1 TetR/AcrR family transcriptional regulator [Verrucomicrobiota bacterium]